MQTPDPQQFFNLVAGTARAEQPALELRYAVIDPAYPGSGAVRLTFEGEDTLSERAYPVLNPLQIALHAGARVFVAITDGNPLILGEVGTPP